MGTRETGVRFPAGELRPLAPRPYIWVPQVNRDKDLRNKELGEIQKVEITTRIEKVDVTIEVEHSSEDIIDHRKKGERRERERSEKGERRERMERERREK